MNLAAAALLMALTAPVPGEPQRVCRVDDTRLTEISGLAVTGTGYVVVNDGSDDPDTRRVFFLDKKCTVTRTVKYSSPPRDTEDLARAADGTVWVADIGDNNANRTTIALWTLAPGAKTPQLFRMRYPDGAHDAEALLLTPTGTPIVIVKTVGSAGLYVPETTPATGRTTMLRRAGEVTLPMTGTSNPFSFAGRLVITGGAISPDGRRAVLRTYADAFEFDAPDGDVVEAVTTGTPRVIALPDEPQGEAITYSADGTALLTISEGKKAKLRRYSLPSTTPTSASPSPSPPPSVTVGPSPMAVTDNGFPIRPVLFGVLLIVAVGAIGALVVRR